MMEEEYSPKKYHFRIITWAEAEERFPGASAYWDIQGSPNDYELFVSGNYLYAREKPDGSSIIINLYRWCPYGWPSPGDDLYHKEGCWTVEESHLGSLEFKNWLFKNSYIQPRYRYHHHAGHADGFDIGLQAARDKQGVVHMLVPAENPGGVLSTLCERISWENIGPMSSTSEEVDCEDCVALLWASQRPVLSKRE